MKVKNSKICNLYNRKGVDTQEDLRFLKNRESKRWTEQVKRTRSFRMRILRPHKEAKLQRMKYLPN